MQPKVGLTEILRGMYSEIITQARTLLTSPQITSADFRSFHSGYTSVLEEARLREPRLYEEFRQDSEEVLTKLRIKARAHAIQDAQELTALLTTLNSHMAGNESMGQVLPEREPSRLLQTGTRDSKVLDIDTIV